MAGRSTKDNVSELSARRAAVARAAPLRGVDPEVAAVVERVSAARGVPVRDLLHRARSAAGVARTRQLAMYLVHTLLGLTLTEVGTVFGRDRTTVSHACALIEDRRDNARFDAEVARLEAEIEAWQTCATAEPGEASRAAS